MINVGPQTHVSYDTALTVAHNRTAMAAIIDDSVAATIAAAWAAPSNPNLTSLAQKGTADSAGLIAEIIREQAHGVDRRALNALIVYAARREWVEECG
jgi:hypothetical protein